MKNIILSLFVYVQVVFSDILKCNYCNDKVSSKVDAIDVTYKLCKFETAFSLVSNSKPDWLFLGIECDDNCANNNVNEGLYCNKDGTMGYYQIENGLLGNKINKIEFEEADCKFTNTESTLSVDRYMPNLWLRNQTISYYVSSGVNTLNFANKAPSKFTISYTDKDPILVSNAPRKSISFILLLCCSSVILFMS